MGSANEEHETISMDDGGIRVGDVIPGDIRIESLLEEGGMGAVYRGRQQGLKRDVAVKVVRPSLTRDASIRRRFEEEGPLLAELEHPNTVRVLQQGHTASGALFLVMELLRGETLRERIVSEGQLPVERCLDIGVQVCASLAEAHGKGLVHRDMKPEHVFLQDHAGRPDFVRVFDFGIARRIEEDDEARMTAPGTIFGTTTYMSPEQANGDKVDARSDTYSLGIVLHEMLTGDPIFRSKSQLAVMIRKLTYEPVAIATRYPELFVPKELDELLSEMMAIRPRARPGSIDEVRERLVAIRAALVDGAAPVPDAKPQLPLSAPAATRRGENLGSGVTMRHEPAIWSTLPDDGSEGLRFDLDACIGRRREKAELLEFVDGFVRSGRSRMLICQGGTGVGKSNLVRWLSRQAKERGDIVVSSSLFSPFQHSVSLRGIKDAVRSLLSLEDALGLNEEQSSVRVTTGLRRWQIHDASLASVLSELIFPGRPVVEQRPESDPDRYWEAVYAAVLTLLKQIGEQTKLLLVLDDVQWADARSAEFLHHLFDAMRSETVSVSLLLVVNNEEIEEKDDVAGLLLWALRHLKPMTHRLSLSPLNTTEFTEFVDALLPMESGSVAELRRMCHGNPFFAQELLQAFYDDHQLQREEEGYRLRLTTGGTKSIPDTLKEVVQRKLNRLGERSALAREAKVVLEHLALYGDGLSLSLLKDALQGDRQPGVIDRLDEVVDDLAGERILRVEWVDGEDELHSYHALVTTVLRSELNQGRRGRRLHHVYASLLKGLLPAASAERQAIEVERVALHSRGAGDFAVALELYDEAGRLWLKRFEHERAKYCLVAYLEIEEECGGPESALPGAAGRARSLDVRLRRADIARSLGEFDAAEEGYASLLQELGEDEGLVTYGSALLGLASIKTHDSADPEDELRRAARFFRRFGFRRELAKAVESIGGLSLDRGRLDLAERFFASAERLYQEEDDLSSLSSVMNRRGLLAIQRGEVAGALALFEKSLAFQEQQGNPIEISRATNNIAIGLLEKNMLTEAERYLREGLQRLTALQYPSGVCILRLNLGATKLLLQDFAGAREELDEAFAIASRLFSRRLMARILVHRSTLELELGELDEALRLAMEAAEMYQTLKVPLQGWSCHILLGELYRKQGDEAQAIVYLERARRLAQRFKLKTGNVLTALLHLARAYQATGRLADAGEALAEARTLAVDLDASEPLEEIEALQRELRAHPS